MARVSDGIIKYPSVLGLTLDRYQELMRMHIGLSSFNGLIRTDGVEQSDCMEPWSQNDRDALALALVTAEEMREHELGYSPALKWVLSERHLFKNPIILDRKWVRQIGLPVLTILVASQAIILRNGGGVLDPVSFEVEVPPDTLADDIVVTLPGDAQAIGLSKVVIVGTTATIYIPRPRLVKLAVMTQDNLMYDDDSVFTDSVDVYLSSVNPVGAKAIWLKHGCTTGGYLSDYDVQDLYPVINNSRIGSIDVRYGDYVDGSWLPTANTYCEYPDFMTVSYQAGEASIINTTLTMALAHTLLPYMLPGRMTPGCNCWQPDLENSKVVTPYGHMMGAYRTWLQDSRSKVMGGIFPGMELNK